MNGIFSNDAAGMIAYSRSLSEATSPVSETQTPISP